MRLYFEQLSLGSHWRYLRSLVGTPINPFAARLVFAQTTLPLTRRPATVVRELYHTFTMITPRYIKLYLYKTRFGGSKTYMYIFVSRHSHYFSQTFLKQDHTHLQPAPPYPTTDLHSHSRLFQFHRKSSHSVT